MIDHELQVVTALRSMRMGHEDVAYEPERIISIVCPSRSGSTAFKNAFCLHPDVCFLAGEEEPYYKLARNGFPWHTSDEFEEPNNPHLIKMLIASEINNINNEFNRNVLQATGIEERPWVKAIECRKTPILVLKTPQNCYRRGVLEALYPDAEISYIALYRDPRAIVNGLMDGWLSTNFRARQLHNGRWWKFDMPPGWNQIESLLGACLLQWKQATKFIADCYSDAEVVNVDNILYNPDWKSAIRDVWLDINLMDTDAQSARAEAVLADSSCTIPVVGATNEPRQDRWRLSRPWLEEVMEYASIEVG